MHTLDTNQHGWGWQPDLPDHRDYTVQHSTVRKWLHRLKAAPDQSGLPSTIDWREYCGPIAEQGDLPTSSAHACVALVQYFERRARGRLIRPSRLFLDANTRRLNGQGPVGGVGLRAALKALVRFGSPPEEYWPYRAAAFTISPPSFTYGFTRGFKKIRFFRLDGRQQTGNETLRLARAFLAAGFAFVLGFPVSNAVCGNAEIPFPTVFDSVRAGMAVLAVGYDDNLRIFSDKGAVLIHTSWGAEWGDHGYCWLPYGYIRERIAVDLWTILKRSWLRADEFHRPNTVADVAQMDHVVDAGP